MADIRIKDLTTTASTTAADDFFAADGTTNGTRKLSAYSPTFGGNATVGGTLTVTGDTSTFGINSSTNNSIKIITGVGTTASPRYGLLDFRNYNDLKSGAYLRVANRESDTNAFLMNVAVRSNADVLTSIATFSDTQLAVLSTTASTSTSSGALVVGNGTSGGLGVGGNAYIGGDLVVPTGGKAIYSQGYVTVKDVQANLLSRGTYLGWTTGLHFYSSNTDYSATLVHQPGNGDLQIYTNATTSNYTSSDIALQITTAKQVQVKATTASTGTSSGALVVSGGVGVAKEVYVGTTLKLANTSQSVTAWGDIGAQLSVAGAVITDTSSSGTVSRAVVNSIAASALAASSTTTYTQAASLFVAGAPTANTNVTITNAYAIYTAGGRINFQGLPTSATGLQAGTLWNDGGTLKVA